MSVVVVCRRVPSIKVAADISGAIKEEQGYWIDIVDAG